MIGFDNGDHYIDDNSEKIDGGVNDFDYDWCYDDTYMTKSHSI